MRAATEYPAWAEQLNTPVTYPAQYLALAEARGLDTAALLATAGLDAAQLATPAADRARQPRLRLALCRPSP